MVNFPIYNKNTCHQHSNVNCQMLTQIGQNDENVGQKCFSVVRL